MTVTTPSRFFFATAIASALVAPSSLRAQTPAGPPPGTSPPAASTAVLDGLRSMMFSPEEVATIRRALGLLPSEKTAIVGPINVIAPPREIPKNIHLSAVADLGGGQWTVWINGIRITPDRQSADFEVIGVNAGGVDIRILGESPMKIRLYPNQTWHGDGAIITEGGFR